jgi:membrane associated rhomboid family serine protease
MQAPPPLDRGPLDRATALDALRRADALLEAGEFREAAALYQRVVGFDDPAVTGAALLGFGESAYRLDQEDAARRAWESVLQLPESPATYQAWRRIAAARVREGDLQRAIAAYREADRRAPQADKAEIASRLGWLTKETGDRRAAGRYFARSRGFGPAISAFAAILGLTIVVSFAAMTGPAAGLERTLMLDKVALARGEYWRLVTVTLLHADLIHLALNMYALYLVGPIVERQYGPAWFATFYLLCAAGGSVATFVLGPGQLGVGASGAIFGLFGILIAARRAHQPVLDRDARRIVPQLGSIVLLNLVLGFMIPSIDNLAHLGGLVTGLWLGFIVRPGRVQTLPGMWEQAGDAGSLERRVFPALGLGVLLTLLIAGVVIGTSEWRSPRRAEAPIAGTVTAGTAVALESARGGPQGADRRTNAAGARAEPAATGPD